MRSLDLRTLPEGPYRLRAAIVQSALPEIHDRTIRFIEEKYPQRETLEAALLFATYSLGEAPPPAAESLLRLGFFPWLEASWEVDWAITHALCANYKATHDSARRALELCVVAAYFLSFDASAADARAWLQSDARTPFFTRAIDERLAKTERWKALSAVTDWPKRLKECYHRLSDVVHVRGVKHAARTVQPFHTVIGAHHVASFDESAVTVALDALVEAVRLIAVVVALTNPVLLVGLPIDQKFGLNPPASGLLNEVQSSRLRSLVPSELVRPLELLAATDPVSRGIIDWVKNLADLTEDEFREQVKSFEKEIGRPRRGTS